MLQKSLIAIHVAMLVVLSGITPVQAENFSLPQAGDDIIGAIRHTKARQEDTLIDIARRFSVGQDEMVMANQNVDRWLPKGGTDILIPQEFILPDAPRSGIVVNIPEMRMYYFPVKARPAPIKPVAASGRKSAAPVCKPAASAPSPVKPAAKPLASSAKTLPGKGAPANAGKSGSQAKGATSPAKGVSGVAKGTASKAPVCQPGKKVEVVQAPVAPTQPDFESAAMGQVITYPVSMGRMDWRTPLGMTRVVDKQKDPSWTPPASIKREHAAKGDPLPDVVPPGPDNPLGKYAMRLGVSGYLIHGTDAAKADGIGMRVTHGCMRMYNEDVAKLFPLVPVGAPVYLVNQPVKLGWKNGWLYMEVSQPLDEDAGVRGHDPDENVSKAQLDREDAQRARFLMKIASNEIEKMRAKTGAIVNMDKVRKAVEKPTGIPLVIGGQESDSSWQAAAASDQGLAPKPKSSTDEASEPSGEETYQRPPRTIEPRPAVTTMEPEAESTITPAPRTTRGVPAAAAPLDEPAYAPPPSRSVRTTPEKGWGVAPAPSRSASGVKTMPYIEGEEEEEQ